MLWPRRGLLLSAASAFAWQRPPVEILQSFKETTVAALATGEGTIFVSARDAGGKATAQLSLDEGARFTQAPLPELFHSLFLIDARTVWAAGPTGLWRSLEAGREWSRMFEGPGLKAVCFPEPDHGFAAADSLTLLESKDAGETWALVGAAAEPDVNPDYAGYTWIDFVNPRVGVVCGSSHPPRAGYTSQVPAWRDPLNARRRKELPAASLTLETRDGGRNWKHSVTSLFGHISRVRYSSTGHGLALIEFHDVFDYPSEVFSIDLRTGKSERAYREHDRAVTDSLFLPSGAALLVVIETPRDPKISTRGAVHLLTSTDLAEWTEVPLPEGVTAGQAYLAPLGGGCTIATDTGVLLRYRSS